MGTRTLQTFEQFEEYPDDGMKHEFIQGAHIVGPPAKFGHGTIQHRLLRSLWKYAEQCHLDGEVRMEAGFRLSADTWLQPDLSFLRSDQVRATRPNEYPEGAPAIAIEVLSESNTPEKVTRKTRLYFKHGSEEVWVIDPQRREVRMHRSGDIRTVAGGELQSDLLPGWSMNVAGLFET